MFLLLIITIRFALLYFVCHTELRYILALKNIQSCLNYAIFLLCRFCIVLLKLCL